jgi:hypothetical protein
VSTPAETVLSNVFTFGGVSGLRREETANAVAIRPRK